MRETSLSTCQLYFVLFGKQFYKARKLKCLTVQTNVTSNLFSPLRARNSARSDYGSAVSRMPVWSRTGSFRSILLQTGPLFRIHTTRREGRKTSKLGLRCDFQEAASSGYEIMAHFTFYHTTNQLTYLVNIVSNKSQLALHVTQYFCKRHHSPKIYQNYHGFYGCCGTACFFTLRYIMFLVRFLCGQSCQDSNSVRVPWTSPQYLLSRPLLFTLCFYLNCI